jgi:hypothetical protein
MYVSVLKLLLYISFVSQMKARSRAIWLFQRQAMVPTLKCDIMLYNVAVCVACMGDIETILKLWVDVFFLGRCRMELTEEQEEVLNYLIDLTVPLYGGGNQAVSVEQVVSQCNLDVNRVRDALRRLEEIGRVAIQKDTADAVVRYTLSA